MKISFDLDGTLIPRYEDEFQTEALSFWQKVLGVEPMRKGAPGFLKRLKKGGHQVGIYTSSLRKKKTVMFWLWTYSVKLDFFINATLSDKRTRKLGINCSKHPPSFGIDIHVDDEPGLQEEANRYNFKVLILPRDAELDKLEKT